MDRGSWIETGPLRKWRKGQRPKVAQDNAALRCQVSLQTIQKWEAGTSRPSAGNMLRIAVVTDIESRRLAANWDAWLSRAE